MGPVSIEHQIEKEAFLMTKSYGAQLAISKCESIAKDYIKDIEELKFYDSEKIKALSNKMHFWFAVASKISKINKKED